MLSAQLSILTSPGPNTPSKPEMDEQQQPLLGWHRPTPVNTSRPKDPYTRLSAILGVATGTGALFAVSVYLRLPNYLSINSKTGLKAAFRVVGGITILNGAFAFIGLPRVEARSKQKDEQKTGFLQEIKRLGSGFRLAFTDLEVALAFVASFAARAQVVAIS